MCRKDKILYNTVESEHHPSHSLLANYCNTVSYCTLLYTVCTVYGTYP